MCWMLQSSRDKGAEVQLQLEVAIVIGDGIDGVHGDFERHNAGVEHQINFLGTMVVVQIWTLRIVVMLWRI